MPAWTAADIYFLAPEFRETPVPVIERYMVVASAQISEYEFGGSAKYAGVLLTAHLLSVANASGNSAPGPVSSVTVGQVSTSYAVDSFSNSGAGRNNLWASKYGQEYIRLASSAGIIGAAVV